MTEPLKVLAFDIGIRNLAWCLMESGDKPAILGWQNYDLLTGSGEAIRPPNAKVTCCKCSVGAAFTNPVAGPTCLRHCPSTHPPLKDLSGGAVYKRIPDLKTLRALEPTVRSATKAKLLAALSAKHSLPIQKVKVTKAVDTELTILHDAIRTFVLSHAESFRKATHILLENQPVLKNPTMKSVQILLFATLRDILQPEPPALKLVHAGKKVQGLEAGDSGYKSRKDASEAKVQQLLVAEKVCESSKWLGVFKAHAKKSDLADAFCMCWDRIEANK
jgi:hypothetical protein